MSPITEYVRDRYCWRIQKCRNVCIPYACFEGKKAWSLALPPPTRHQDRLASVAEASIGSRLEEVFHMYLFRGRQPDASPLVQPPFMRNCPREYLKKDAKSSAA